MVQLGRQECSSYAFEAQKSPRLLGINDHSVQLHLMPALNIVVDKSPQQGFCLAAAHFFLHDHEYLFCATGPFLTSGDTLRGSKIQMILNDAKARQANGGLW